MSSERANAGGRPTDLELMLFADGELDDARYAEVEAYLARDGAARSKVAALQVSSDFVREYATASLPSNADALTDAVMTAIDAEPAPGKAASNVVPLRRPKPAAERARHVVAFVAVGLAAAAAVLFWSRAPKLPVDVAQTAPSSVDALAGREAPTAVVPPAAVASNAGTDPTPDGDLEPGVEVAAVDFGARVGTIFYVPTGAATSYATTTVVWLNDESAGDE